MSNHKPISLKFQDETELLKPLKARKPKVYLVSDLFHENVKDEWIDKVFAVMALCEDHVFQVLTKRPERMKSYFADLALRKVKIQSEMLNISLNADSIQTGQASWKFLPLPNVHLGVSIENQKTADERITLLLETPAAIRFLSCEPLLEEIDFKQIPFAFDVWKNPLSGELTISDGRSVLDESNQIVFDTNISWVICGGESGHGARPCDISWIRSIVQQCKATGTACFVKQLGKGRNDYKGVYIQPDSTEKNRAAGVWTYSNRKGGDIEEFPNDLKIREFPKITK